MMSTQSTLNCIIFMMYLSTQSITRSYMGTFICLSKSVNQWVSTLTLLPAAIIWSADKSVHSELDTFTEIGVTGLLGTGRSGGRGAGGRLLYLSLHCHHQNDSCIKMGSDESHFNVSLTWLGTVTNDFESSHGRLNPSDTECSQTTIFEEKLRRAEADSNRGPSAYQPNALPLGQTGSLYI